MELANLREAENQPTRRRLDLPLLKRHLIQEISCMACGRSFDRSDIHIHHINLNPKDNRLSNLSLVCRVCHKEYHRNGNKSTAPRYRSEPRKKKATRKLWGGMTVLERFDITYKDRGGINKFREMYDCPNVSTAEIGLHFSMTRERVRQIAILIGMPTRGYGFMKGRVLGPRKSTPVWAALKEKRMSVEDFAAALGTSKATAYQILGGNRSLSPLRAKRISEILGIGMEELMVYGRETS